MLGDCCYGDMVSLAYAIGKAADTPTQDYTGMSCSELQTDLNNYH